MLSINYSNSIDQASTKKYKLIGLNKAAASQNMIEKFNNNISKESILKFF